MATSSTKTRSSAKTDAQIISEITGPSKIDEVVSELQHAGNTEITRKDLQRKRLSSVYSAEPKRTVMIAPMYKAFFGNNMHVSINGISISVPCDGRPYEIPETFASVVQERLRLENDKQAKQKRFSDISRNSESSPGELALH
jgi:hypothetical protein